MTFSHGRKCEVAVDRYDATEFFKGANLSVDVDTAETTTFRKTYKTHAVGQVAGTVDLDGFYDNVQSPLFKALVATDTPFVATVGPEGLRLSDHVRMLSVESTNLAESSSVGDVVMTNWSMQSTEEIFYGVGLKDPTTAVTVTGVSASHDFGAAATLQTYAAHFHLFALTGTSVTLTIQDSADNSTFATLGTLTTGVLTGVQAVRLTGTGTVRRYVRVAHTLVGSSALFTAAVARRAS